MCTFLVWRRIHADYPLIAAGNRDEYFSRPASPPRILWPDPVIFGGKDEQAGGSWFVATSAGLVVALTNRREAGAHDASRRSRGALVLEVARAASLADARRRIARVDPASYNPFILFVGDAEDAFVVTSGAAGIETAAVGDGAHAITNWDLDAPQPRKAARALARARDFTIGRGESPSEVAPRLGALLADRDGGDASSCVHRPGGDFGTRSLSIAFVGREPGMTRFYFTDGPPCVADLVEMPTGFRDESGGGASKTAGLP